MCNEAEKCSILDTSVTLLSVGCFIHIRTLQVSCASEGNVAITVGQTVVLCQSAGQQVGFSIDTYTHTYMEASLG